MTKIKRFTLVELLVVIAIIGILASMLLPSLRNARRKAFNSVCVSNLRQNGAGLMLYSTNNSGKYPPRRGFDYPSLLKHTTRDIRGEIADYIDINVANCPDLNFPGQLPLTEANQNAVYYGYSFWAGYNPGVSSALDNSWERDGIEFKVLASSFEQVESWRRMSSHQDYTYSYDLYPPSLRYGPSFYKKGTNTSRSFMDRNFLMTDMSMKTMSKLKDYDSRLKLFTIMGRTYFLPEAN